MSGYKEMTEGIFVHEEDEFDYALEQCIESESDWIKEIKWTNEFRNMLVEWFYSGNWVKED